MIHISNVNWLLKCRCHLVHQGGVECISVNVSATNHLLLFVSGHMFKLPFAKKTKKERFWLHDFAQRKLKLMNSFTISREESTVESQENLVLSNTDLVSNAAEPDTNVACVKTNPHKRQRTQRDSSQVALSKIRGILHWEAVDEKSTEFQTVAQQLDYEIAKERADNSMKIRQQSENENANLSDVYESCETDEDDEDESSDGSYEDSFIDDDSEQSCSESEDELDVLEKKAEATTKELEQMKDGKHNEQ